MMLHGFLLLSVTSLPKEFIFAGISGLFPGFLLGIGLGVMYSSLLLKRDLQKKEARSEVIAIASHVNRKISTRLIVIGIICLFIFLIIGLILFGLKISMFILLISSFLTTCVMLLIMIMIAHLSRLP